MPTTINDLQNNSVILAPDIQIMNEPAKEINYYSLAVTVTNGGGALSNEVICVKIDHKFLVSRGQSSQTFNDLRVYDEDGVTPINFWVDSPFYSWTKVFIKVPVIGASTSRVITLEYGNPELEDLSDIGGVFGTVTYPKSVFNSALCKTWIKASDPFPDLRHEDSDLNKAPFLSVGSKFARNHANIKESFIGNALGDNSDNANIPKWTRELNNDEQYWLFDTENSGFMTFQTDFPHLPQIPAGSDYEVYLVEKTNIYKSSGVIIGDTATLVGDNGIQVFTNQFGGYFFGGFNVFTSVTLGTTSTKRLFTGVLDRNNDSGLGFSAIRIRINRSTVSTNATTGTSPATANRLKYGARGGSFANNQDYWDGQLYESLVFAPNLAVAERNTIEKYLSLKHNLATSGYPTIAIGAETEIADERAWTSYYPFVDSYRASQILNEGIYGIAESKVICHVINSLVQTVAVGSPSENWDTSSSNRLSQVIGMFSRSLTATISGVIDTCSIEKLDGAVNLHDLASFAVVNQTVTTVYSSAEEDFISVDVKIADHTLLSLTGSYIQFENLAGTLAKRGLFNENLNVLISGAKCTIKIRKSAFTNQAGTPTWAEVSQIARIRFLTTSGSTLVYHANLRLEVNRERLFKIGDKIRILNHVSSDRGVTYAKSQVFEGVISSRDTGDVDWKFEALPIIEANYSRKFSELETTPNRYLLLENKFLDKSNILQRNLFNADEFLAIVRPDPEGFNSQYDFGTNVVYNGFVKNNLGVISQNATSFTFTSALDSDIVSKFQSIPNTLHSFQTIQVGAYLRLASGALSNFDKIEIQWYNSSFTFISSTTSASLSITANWTKFSHDGLVPFGASRFKIKVPSAMNGATIEIDKLYFTSLMQLSYGGLTQYNGTSAYSDINLTNNSGSVITMECWYKGTVPRSILRQQNTSGAFMMLSWQNTPTSYRCILSNDGGTGGLNWPATIYNNQWHHLAMSWQQNTTNGFKIYFDGLLHAQRNSTNVALPNIGVNMQMMTFFNNTTRTEFGSGQIRNVRIWGGIRTLAQIREFMYKDIVGNEANLRYADDFTARAKVRRDKTDSFNTTDVNTTKDVTDIAFVASSQNIEDYEPIDFNDTGGFGGRLLRLNGLSVPKKNNVIAHNYNFSKAGNSTAFIFTSRNIGEVYETLAQNEIGMIFTDSKGRVNVRSIYENLLDYTFDIEVSEDLIFSIKAIYNDYPIINSVIIANNKAFLPIQDERNGNIFYTQGGGGAGILLNATSNYINVEASYSKSSQTLGVIPTQVYVLGSHIDAGYLFCSNTADPLNTIVTTFQRNKFMLDNEFWLVISNGSPSTAYPYILTGNALNMQLLNPRENIDIAWRLVDEDGDIKIYDNEPPATLSVGDVVKMENKQVRGDEIIFDNEFVTGGFGGSTIDPYGSMPDVLKAFTQNPEYYEYEIDYIDGIEIGSKIKTVTEYKEQIIMLVLEKEIKYSESETRIVFKGLRLKESL